METKAAVAKTPKYAASRGNLNDTIQLVSKENPKHPGSKTFRRFALYRNGMTVAEALKAGVKAPDIRWDLAHGFIALKVAAEKKAA